MTNVAAQRFRKPGKHESGCNSKDALKLQCTLVVCKRSLNLVPNVGVRTSKRCAMTQTNNGSNATKGDKQTHSAAVIHVGLAVAAIVARIVAHFVSKGLHTQATTRRT